MENLIFALNATVPLFLMILLGWFLRRVGILNEAFNKCANDYVFQCSLPVSLFLSVAKMDFYSDFDPRFCLFCFTGTTVMFFGVWGLAWLWMKDKSQIGAFAQAACRSSAAILGVALAVNIYGNSGLVPMMIMSAVPFFNVYAVLILSFSPHLDSQGELVTASGGGNTLKKACLNVIRNPLIIGVVLGIPFAVFQWKLPTFALNTLNSIGGTASPVALLVIGASFSGGEAMTRWKGAVLAAVIKLFLLPAVFLPLAAFCGFRESALIAILIMTGSPTTVSCFVMAKKMGGDSVLTSNTVLISTLLGAVSITMWLYFLRGFGLI